MLDPRTNTFINIPNVDSLGVQDEWLSRQMVGGLKGQGAGAWDAARTDRIAELQALLGGGVFDPSDITGPPPGAASPFSFDADAMEKWAAEQTAATWSIEDGLLPEQAAAYREELAGLEAMAGSQNPLAEWGDLASLGPAAQKRLQETEDALRAQMTGALDETAGSAMAELYRRGVGGSTAEAELQAAIGGESANIELAVEQFSNAFEGMDFDRKQGLMLALEAGMRADSALSYQQGQGTAQNAFAAQSLAQNAAAMDYQRQLLHQTYGDSAMANLGQSLGYLGGQGQRNSLMQAMEDYYRTGALSGRPMGGRNYE